MVLASPVLVRELICAARDGMNYRLRVAVGATGILFLQAALVSQTAGQESGPQLFEALQSATLLILFVFGPFLTADVIAREKREGTLDLLFLTPLSAGRIVRSKFQAQALRLFTIWLVLFPLGMVPFLAGGLSPGDVCKSLAAQLVIMLIGLSSGLAASAWNTRTLPALAMAVVLSLLVFVAGARVMTLLTYLDPIFLEQGAQRGGWYDQISVLPPSFAALIDTLEVMNRLSLWGIAMNLFQTAGITGLLLKLTARKIAGDTKKAGASRWENRLRETFLKPRYWTTAFRRSMARRMDANPLIWLEYRTAWSRSGRLTLAGLLILIESMVLLLAPYEQFFFSVQFGAALVLLVVVSISAAGSFLKEKESGAFELLLVAPFTERSLLGGRLRAVWSYYWPVGAALLFFLWLGLSNTNLRFDYSFVESRQRAAIFLSMLLSVVTIPVAGLFFALRLRSLLATTSATVLCGLVGPMYLWIFVARLGWYIDMQTGVHLLTAIFNDDFPFVQATLATHLLVAFCFFIKSHEILQQRQFV